MDKYIGTELNAMMDASIVSPPCKARPNPIMPPPLTVTCPPDLIPVRGSAGAAAYDLKACGKTTIPAGGWAIVHTGVRAAIPPGHYGKIEARSGLHFRSGITPFQGVIDEDYRGEILVELTNRGTVPYYVSHGDRIAQLIIHRYEMPTIQRLGVLPGTERGMRGFGSTGK